MVCVPMVATMGGILIFVIRNPLKAPTKDPTNIDKSMTTKMLEPGFASIKLPEMTAQSAMVEEIDKSIPPVIRTGNIPNAIMP